MNFQSTVYIPWTLIAIIIGLFFVFRSNKKVKKNLEDYFKNKKQE
ncbi:hypothetical protein [Spongiivirga citrea]|nr:hypothetical protein [Spongiivirga citrea]